MALKSNQAIISNTFCNFGTAFVVDATGDDIGNGGLAVINASLGDYNYTEILDTIIITEYNVEYGGLITIIAPVDNFNFNQIVRFELSNQTSIPQQLTLNINDIGAGEGNGLSVSVSFDITGDTVYEFIGRVYSTDITSGCTGEFYYRPKYDSTVSYTKLSNIYYYRALDAGEEDE